MSDATPETSKYLTILGQGDAARTLDTLFDTHPARLFQSHDTAPEIAVQVLNMVTLAIASQNRLTDDQAADLCSFFIQRIKYWKVPE